MQKTLCERVVRFVIMGSISSIVRGDKSCVYRVFFEELSGEEREVLKLL